jgi:putative ABC transport system permease protein
MKLESNNNIKIINHLAINSIKGNKMRNFFIIFAIVLSVSLLMVMSLFNVGLKTSKQRAVSNVQHVIYHKVTEEQIAALLTEVQVDFLTLDKRGQGIETTPSKDGSVKITTMSISEGTAPDKVNEVAVTKDYLKEIEAWDGIETEKGIGTKISLTFLDGTTEKFIVSGILNMSSKSNVYPIIFSKEYAIHGSQLKDVAYDAIVRIDGATQMTQSEFLEIIRGIGAKCFIERKNINENNYFIDTLPGGTRETQEILVIVGIGLGILFVSILVIYSVFYLSVIGRIRQFGQLRTIGMTKKQIKKMIIREGLLLSAIAIPIGLVIGGIIGYFIHRTGWDWRNTLIIAGVVIIADIIMVLISIRKPAKIASTISPIEAAKFSGYQEKNGKSETKKLYRKITPFHLAKMSATRNRKKTFLTLVSLGVGGILFMLATTLITSMNLEDYSRQGGFQYGEFDMYISLNASEIAEYGYTDIQLHNPFNVTLKEQIEAIDGVTGIKTWSAVNIRWEAGGEIEEDNVTSFSKNQVSGMNEMMEEGSVDYDEMLKNDEIIVRANDVIKEIYGWNYKIGDTVKLTFYNGKQSIEKEYIIRGFLDAEYSRIDLGYGWFVLPEEALNEIMNNMNLTRGFVISTEEDKTDQVGEALQVIVDENPLLNMSTLKDRMELDEESFSMIFAMILGLALFIIGFSIINLVNTLITNVVTRKQEFAMLQSIGMTSRQLTQMIQVEGLMLSFVNALITLIFGSLLGYEMIRLLRHVSADYMYFTFPIWYFLYYVAFIVIIPVVVSHMLVQYFKKKSLVERFRESD